MTFDEVNARIDQHMEHDIHRGICILYSIFFIFIYNLGDRGSIYIIY